jgi:glycine/D-amino acid oxidase-like deaminating enzyme
MRVLIVGGGIFGVTAALEMTARGHDVTLCDPGALPHPLAESTDLSKVVRCDYGADVAYTEYGERAIEGWRRWNEQLAAPLYHETGVMFLARSPMAPGGFEHDSYALLKARGHRIERLDDAAIAARYPAYRRGAFVDGYFHAEGGWAEAGAVVVRLAEWARAKGVTIVEHRAVAQLTDEGVITVPASALDVGVRDVAGVAGSERIRADAVIVCAGSWTQHLIPELAGSLRAIGQPVFHFQPRDPLPFDGSLFPVFGADIARTGYYGFPLANGVVKIANHGTGREISPAKRHEIDVTEAERDDVRAFVRDTFPALADTPIVHTRCCVYGDSLDGHFWITPHPERPNLIVAAGGSGHAFKFAPVLGALIADAVEGRVVPRFRWRPEGEHARGDAARSDH